MTKNSEFDEFIYPDHHTEKKYKNEISSLSKDLNRIRKKANIYRMALEKRNKQNKLDAIFKSILRKNYPEEYKEIINEMRRQNII
jgi:hypothetical protein